MLISWNISVLIMSPTAKNKDYCITCREKNADKYQKADRLRKKYALMDLKVKKKKKKLKSFTPIFHLVHFFCVLATWAVIPSNSATKAIFFTVCCLRESLYFSLLVVYEKIFSWVFRDHILNQIWLTWIVVLLLNSVRKVTWCLYAVLLLYSRWNILKKTNSKRKMKESNWGYTVKRKNLALVKSNVGDEQRQEKQQNLPRAHRNLFQQSKYCHGASNKSKKRYQSAHVRKPK